MRLGLIARCDSRGLAVQTEELWRHLRPDATLVVVMDGQDARTPQHPERYDGPGVEMCASSELIAGRVARRWLLRTAPDLLLTAETFYDDQFPARAREIRCRTVVHGNFEFLRWSRDKWLPRPDLFLAPSTWHLDEWPARTTYLPLGVARDRLPPRDWSDPVVTLVHPVGLPAAGDRAGTEIVLDAAAILERSDVPVRFVVRALAEHGMVQHLPKPRSGNVEVVVEPEPDYWRIYEGADALVLPRRYGGQSLPMIEACSLNLPVFALAREPERTDLPGQPLVAARADGWQRCQGPRMVRRWSCTPEALASRIGRLVADPDAIRAARESGEKIAQARSWEVMLPRWREMLERVAAGDPVPA